MKKGLILFLALILLAPSLVFSNIFSFKAGMFFPRAQSDLWETEFENMDFNKNNYQTTNLGFAYEYFLTRQMSIVLGVDAYSKNKSGIYEGYVGYIDLIYDPDFEDFRDFAFPDDYEGEYIPGHSFNVSITPIQFSLKLTPMGRRGKLIPYVGGGVGLFLWSVRLQGDRIDFDDEWYYNEVTGELHNTDPDFSEDIRIYPVDLVAVQEENRITIGYHAFAGIMVPFTRNMTLEVEFKYSISEGKFPEDDPLRGFHGFEPFDLSGYQISLGLNYWF